MGGGPRTALSTPTGAGVPSGMLLAPVLPFAGAVMRNPDGMGIFSGMTLCFLPSAASLRSASSPWRSPLPSFLYAYSTAICLLRRYWPCIASRAVSDASNESKLTKP